MPKAYHNIVTTVKGNFIILVIVNKNHNTIHVFRMQNYVHILSMFLS
jgi:hypothetical protein